MNIPRVNYTLLDELTHNLYVANAGTSKIYNEKYLRTVLAPANINFTLEGINRLQSTLICGLKDSYTQQSQRYVKMTPESVSFPKNIPDELKDEGMSLISYAFKLYEEMTEVLPGKKGRLTNDDFVHGISFEDGRYILPLAVSTNLTVSLSGDKLIDFYYLCATYPLTMEDIKNKLEEFLPKELTMNIRVIVSAYSTNIPNIYKKALSTVDSDLDISLLNIGDETYSMIGALNSQNQLSGEEVFDSWGDNAYEKGAKMLKNVLSYGHKSVIEHTRSTFAMKASLCAYHQIIRHRLQSIYPEDITKIICRDLDQNYYVPKSFMNNPHIYAKFKDLMGMYNVFITRMIKTYSHEFVTLFVPNNYYIRMINSSNAANDCHIFRERLCLTAQTEIRELFHKKFDIMYNYMPDIYRKSLPPCVFPKGVCKEGKLTCGKAQEMKELYKNYLD